MVQLGVSRSQSDLLLRGYSSTATMSVEVKKLPRGKSSDLVKVHHHSTETVVKAHVNPQTTKPLDTKPASSATPEFPTKSQDAPQRTYGEVIMSMENCILPENKLHPTPSMKDGMDARTEWHLRRIGCDFIQHAGLILKLPQTAMATAQVLYHRFYYARSFAKRDYFKMAMACVYLSSKVEECVKRLRDIVSVFVRVRQTLCGLPLEPVLVDAAYAQLKADIIRCERHLLKELGFCVHVKHPHKLIFMYLRFLDLTEHQSLVQRAWNIMNDSLRTDLFVRFSVEAITCGCIVLATHQLQVHLPSLPLFADLFGVSANDVTEVAQNINVMYAVKMPSILEVEEKLKIYDKSAVDAKKGPLATVKDQEASPQSTPVSDNGRGTSREIDRERTSKARSRHRSSRSRSRSRSRGGRRRSRSRTRSPKRRRSPDVRKRSPRRSVSRSPRRRSRSPNGRLDEKRRDRRRSVSRSREDERRGSRRRSRSRDQERRRSRSASPLRRNGRDRR